MIISIISYLFNCFRTNTYPKLPDRYKHTAQNYRSSDSNEPRISNTSAPQHLSGSAQWHFSSIPNNSSLSNASSPPTVGATQTPRNNNNICDTPTSSLIGKNQNHQNKQNPQQNAKEEEIYF